MGNSSSTSNGKASNNNSTDMVARKVEVQVEAKETAAERDSNSTGTSRTARSAKGRTTRLGSAGIIPSKGRKARHSGLAKARAMEQLHRLPGMRSSALRVRAEEEDHGYSR